jgi:hypothetical protein
LIELFNGSFSQGDFITVYVSLQGAQFSELLKSVLNLASAHGKILIYIHLNIRYILSIKEKELRSELVDMLLPMLRGCNHEALLWRRAGGWEK